MGMEIDEAGSDDEAIRIHLALASAGCSDLNCLLATDGKTIRTKVLGAAAGLTDGRWGGPVVDGVSLTDTPLGLIYAKRYNNRVPVIVGSNSDEQAFFTLQNRAAFPVGLTEAQFDAALGAGKPGGMPTATLAKQLRSMESRFTAYAFPDKLGAASASGSGGSGDEESIKSQSGAADWYYCESVVLPELVAPRIETKAKKKKKKGRRCIVS